MVSVAVFCEDHKDLDFMIWRECNRSRVFMWTFAFSVQVYTWHLLCP